MYSTNISTISFLIFTSQLTYSIVYRVCDTVSVMTLLISGSGILLFDGLNEVEEHQLIIESALTETTKIHEEIESRYASIVSSRIDDECEHIFKKVVIGYDDTVRRCVKCEHEVQC
jgi:dynactin complex subunit